MPLAIPCLLLPIRFLAANPTIRVTLSTTSTLTLSVNPAEDYWISGDNNSSLSHGDLAGFLQRCLRTHPNANAYGFVVSLTADNFLVITNTTASDFTILWGDALTTVDPTIFGFTAISYTSSMAELDSPNQTKGYFSSGLPFKHDSLDEPTLVGSVVFSHSGSSRGNLISTIYERELQFHMLNRSVVKQAFSPASQPYGSWEYSWASGGMGQGCDIRVYSDRSLRNPVSFARYKINAMTRPWQRDDTVSILKYQGQLNLIRSEAAVSALSNSYSLELNGTNQYATVPSVSALNLTTQGTWSMWVKRTSASARAQDVLWSKVDGALLTGQVSIRETSTWTNLQIMAPHIGGFTDRIDFTISAVPAVNTWFHLAVTFNNGIFNAYINGVSLGAGTISGTLPTSLLSTSVAMQFGADVGATSPFLGRLDECALFNTAFSQAQVQTLLYNSLTPLPVNAYNSLISWWRWESSPNDSFAANNASLVNAPVYSTDHP